MRFEFEAQGTEPLIVIKLTRKELNSLYLAHLQIDFNDIKDKSEFTGLPILDLKADDDLHSEFKNLVDFIHKMYQVFDFKKGL